MTDNNSTISTPAWLVLLVILFLVLRISVGVMESYRQDNVEAINWTAPSSADLSGRDYQSKLVLYSFTSKDNDSCSKLNNTSLLSKNVVNIVNAEFVPVQVQNIEVLDETPESKLNIELQQRFAVFIYPTLVVTLPNGKVIESHSTYIGPKSLLILLQRCLKKAKYVEGLDYIGHAKYYQATKALEEWLRTVPTNARELANGALYCALSYSMLSNAKEVRSVLENVLKNSNDADNADTNILLARFLIGDLNSDKLLEDTANYGDRDPRVYYFIGMQELCHHNVPSAVRYLNLADKGVYNSSEVHELVERQLSMLNQTNH